MTPRRWTAIVRGLGSLLLLVVVLVGPPAALASIVGWPLPTSIPDPTAMDQALRSGLSDQVIVNTLATIAWLAWLQIAVAIIAEILAVGSRRPAIRLPVLPGVQATAARLVAGIAMMTATLTPTAAMATTPPPVVVAAPAPTADFVVSAPAFPQTSAVALLEAPPADTPGGGVPTVTVERHDSYWAIAERTLGSGYRWREIRDLNVGRAMVTGDVIAPNSDLVHPGWILELPADAHTDTAEAATNAEDFVEAPPIAASRDDASTELTVHAGDNFWTLAEQQLADTIGHTPTATETIPYWQDLIDANSDRLVEPSNPDLIIPGQELSIPDLASHEADGAPSVDPAPAEPVELPTDPVTPPAPEDAPTPTNADSRTPTPTEARTPTSTPDTADQPTDDSVDSPTVQVAAGIASLALATGVTLALRRRRKRAAHRAPTRRPRPTPDEHQELQAVLAVDSDTEAIEDLRGCLAGLARSVAVTGGKSRPVIVQHSDDYLGVLLEHRATTAPQGWRVDAGGTVWSFEGGSNASPAVDDTCVAPLLVTLGRPDEGGQIYLDLEAENLIALTGDPSAVADTARAILTELALTPLAETLQVLVVGHDLIPATAVDLDHVTVAECWDDVCDDLTAWAEQSHHVLETNGWPNTFVARGIDPDHDALAPVVVVANDPPPAQLVETLRAHRPSTLAVVAIGDVDGATVIECAPDALSIPEIGLVCSPYPLDAPRLADIAELLETANEEGAEPIWPDPDPAATTGEPRPDAGADESAPPRYGLLIGHALDDESIEPAAPEQTSAELPHAGSDTGVTEPQEPQAEEFDNVETNLATGDSTAATDPEPVSLAPDAEVMDSEAFKAWRRAWLDSVDAETEAETETEIDSAVERADGEGSGEPASTAGFDHGGGTEVAGPTDEPPDRPILAEQLSLVPPRPDADEFDEPLVEPDCTILVRVLGDIAIEGGEVLTGKQTAVVTYIALHGTVTTDRLENAVWGSAGGSQRKRLTNAMSECRAVVGHQVLPASSEGRYRAGPGLITDLELFELRVGQASGQDATSAVDTLRSALDLLTGPLFSYRSADKASFTWVDTENWVSTWELKVASVAERCARLLLELERPDEAAEVAVNALSVIPTHSTLTETLMQSYADSGDSHAVRRVYDDHLKALRSLEIDDADESTADLFDSLTRRKTG